VPFTCFTYRVVCRWCCVHVVLCTCHSCGDVYVWHCVHVVQLVRYTCGIVQVVPYTYDVV